MPERDDDFLPIAVFREFEKRIDETGKLNAKLLDLVHVQAKEAAAEAKETTAEKFESHNRFDARINERVTKEIFSVLEDRVRVLENARNMGTGRSALSEPLLMILVAGGGGLVAFFIQLLFKK